MPWTVKEAPQGGLHVALQAHHCLARATDCREMLERVRPAAEIVSKALHASSLGVGLTQGGGQPLLEATELEPAASVGLAPTRG
jgi:hypothetical protein